MESDWTLSRLDGRDDVVLVTVELHNTSSVARRVRVKNRLDGPVLPPRRAGVPEAGWDGDGFVGVVPAGERRPLGYACPAPEERPPVSVVDEGRATADRERTTPEAAVRGLGDPRPPVDALPTPSSSAVDDPPDANTGPPEREGDLTAVPPSIEAWLTAVERRVERGERLTDASAETAADVLEASEDGADVTDLEERLTADVATLRAVSKRTASLADRAAAVDVPVAALRRLA